MIDEKILKTEERIILTLRSLYSGYGYFPYRMSKFEEYEFYIRNKDFLVSDRVIAFSDTDGKLMALKPDVTLSVIRAGSGKPETSQKIYYNENVYRATDTSNGFKEIMQTGVECIGSNGPYEIYETVSLAKKSLERISSGHMLVVSHTGLVTDFLKEICPEPDFTAQALPLLEKKSAHELKKLLAAFGAEEKAEALDEFMNLDGSLSSVKEKIKSITSSPWADAVCSLASLLERENSAEKIRFDFSLIGNIRYYNGFVMRGYVEGIHGSVLAGGQYDRLLEKFGRKYGAIGFAIYLDMLEALAPDAEKRVDELVLFDSSTDPAAVAAEVERVGAAGEKALACASVPSDTAYSRIKDLRGGKNA